MAGRRMGVGGLVVQEIRLSGFAKFAFGMGGIANGVKLAALSTFLMLFYNQVLGLRPEVVATVIMITLVFDAAFDPLIGYWSDNLRTRWGRRHPFLYASLLPYPLLFLALWNPPDLPHSGLAVYLLAVLVLLRFFDTFFELPAWALGPELARDYDDRTEISAWRAGCGILGTATISLLAYNVFLKEDPGGTGGVLSRDGYLDYSLAAAAAIFISIAFAAAGTHRYIPQLRKPKKRKLTATQVAREFRDSLSNRSFVAVALGGLLAATANGMSQGIDIYWRLYLYKLSQAEISAIVIVAVVASVFGTITAKRLSSRFGKRNAAAGLFITSLIGSISPLLLVINGVVSEPEVILALLLPFGAMSTGANACALVMMGSMLMDIVEQVEVNTGRRAEGLLMSIESLVKKVTSGVGILFAGLILAAVAFPAGAERVDIPIPMLREMAYYYIPIKSGIILVCLASLSFYSLNRDSHEENLARLRGRSPAE